MLFHSSGTHAAQHRPSVHQEVSPFFHLLALIASLHVVCTYREAQLVTICEFLESNILSDAVAEEFNALVFFICLGFSDSAAR